MLRLYTLLPAFFATHPHMHEHMNEQLPVLLVPAELPLLPLAQQPFHM
jgi:hypothetical protein